MTTMIPVTNQALPPEAARRLGEYQGEVDSSPDYAGRVAAAKSLFKRRNRATDPAFKAVRQVLRAMCHGSRRCMYCEDAPADEVEHIRPKDLYPEAAFVWENYLYACGPCNGPKNNQYAVIWRRQVVDVTRRKDEDMVPPRKGPAAMINPLDEDPFDFFMLDLLDTFEFQIIARPGTVAYDRASYTRKVLRLNDREDLRKARKTAFGAYRSLLKDYGDEIAAGKTAAADRIKQYICDSNHATVWAEMKRQRKAIGDLKVLFDRAPDALNWPFPIK